MFFRSVLRLAINLIWLIISKQKIKKVLVSIFSLVNQTKKKKKKNKKPKTKKTFFGPFLFSCPTLLINRLLENKQVFFSRKKRGKTGICSFNYCRLGYLPKLWFTKMESFNFKSKLFDKTETWLKKSFSFIEKRLVKFQACFY